MIMIIINDNNYNNSLFSLMTVVVGDGTMGKIVLVMLTVTEMGAVIVV